MEIKKEVSYSEEVTLDDDFTIYISDDSCDGHSNSWAGKLSQDQDFVVKKVIESEKNKKRKGVKQIEAMPLVPSKRVRRNSVSSNVATGSSRQTNTTTNTEMSSKQPPMVKNDQTCTNDSTTSNCKSSIPTVHSLNTSVKPTVKNTQTKFVDRLDPFVKTLQKTETPKRFEDALAFNVTGPKKLRIARQPKPVTTILTTATTSRKSISILRKQNGTWPSELSSHANETKPVRRVHFPDVLYTVLEYEPNDDENCEIIISLPKKSMNARAAHVEESNSFENDPLHEIITDITEWKPEWLVQKSVTPPITDVNLIICPLLNTYASFENYKT